MMMILIETQSGEYVKLDSLRIIREGPEEEGWYLASGYSPLSWDSDEALLRARLLRLATYLEDLKVIRPITIVRYCSYE